VGSSIGQGPSPESQQDPEAVDTTPNRRTDGGSSMPAQTHSPLSGRVSLVTGVSRRRGIGFAIAQRLRSLGADVFIQSWRAHDDAQPWGPGEATQEQLVAELFPDSTLPRHLSLDLADPDAPRRLVETARNDLGHIDILVANHARSSKQSLDNLTAEELDLAFQVNARAVLLLIKEWAAQYEESRNTGRVIMLTSGQHLGPMPSEIPYAASKAVVEQMTRHLAFHLAPRGITVNTINPGPTDTGWADPDTHQVVRRRMPFGRWGTPDDAARLIAWLTTDDARWITGQVINSEGGFSR
jgi:3-oxoacyl-[acyl-carrier protein] reductase